MTATKTPKGPSIREALAALKKPRLEPEPAPAPRRAVKSGRKARPARPVDALAAYWPDRPERLLAVTGVPGSRDVDPIRVTAVEPYIDNPELTPKLRPIQDLYRPARRAPRGPAEMIRTLARRGITLRPTIDGAFVVESEGGRLDEPTRMAITVAGHLLRAYLHGTPLRCAMPTHVGGEPPEAVTLALGGAAWCGEC